MNILLKNKRYSDAEKASENEDKRIAGCNHRTAGDRIAHAHNSHEVEVYQG